MKFLYVLLDGLGDTPHPKLNNQTPLEVANTPILNNLVQKGVTGLVTPVKGNFPPESDVGVFSMLGYEFGNEYVGRGVIESIGSGVNFNEGDLAFRLNFATIDSNNYVIDRRAGRNLSDNEANIIVNDINKNVKLNDSTCSFIIKNTEAHRGTIVFKRNNGDFSSNISNTDPAVDKFFGFGVAKKLSTGMKLPECKPLDDNINTIISSKIVNEFSIKASKVLLNHPVNIKRRKLDKFEANCLLLRDAGTKLPNIVAINQKYNLKFSCIVDLPVEKGIAQLLNMDSFFTNNLLDYENKALKSLDLLEKYDFIYVHLKGPDEAGHDGEVLAKKKIIEDIDTRFFKIFIENNKFTDTRIIVASDHATPCISEAHTSDPVPLLISGKNISADNTTTFSERAVVKGKLGKLYGSEVINLAINL